MADTVRRKNWSQIQLIGQRIREARERLGMTQDDLALCIGKSRDAISRYERGSRAMVITELPTLAQALKVPIGYFFADEEATTETATFLANEIEHLPLSKQKAILERLRFELDWWKTHQAPEVENTSPENIPVT